MRSGWSSGHRLKRRGRHRRGTGVLASGEVGAYYRGFFRPGDGQSPPLDKNQWAKPARTFVPMANSAQARKRARQNDAQREHNASLRSEFRTAIKRVRAAIEAGDKAAARAVFQTAVSTLDSIADKKIYHKNKAARHKSRLSAAIKAMA